MDKKLYDAIIAIGFGILVATVITILTIVINGVANDNEFDKRDAIIQECIASERYTREECIFIGSNFDD